MNELNILQARVGIQTTLLKVKLNFRIPPNIFFGLGPKYLRAKNFET